MTTWLVVAVCILIFILILLWDAWLYADKVERNSISQVVIDLSKKSPFLPWFIGLVMGILAGHWFA